MLSFSLDAVLAIDSYLNSLSRKLVDSPTCKLFIRDRILVSLLIINYFKFLSYSLVISIIS